MLVGQTFTCSQAIFNESPKLTIFSNACPTGWSAACKENSTRGNWTPEESCFHINTLEMATALYALKFYTRDVSNCQNQLNGSKLQHQMELYFLLPKNFGIIVWEKVWVYLCPT